MTANKSWILSIAAALGLAAGAAAVPVLAQTTGSGFVTVKSSHDYSSTVDALQRSIKSNGLMVMGQVNQGRILTITGLHLKGAESFLVGNPRVGKKLFSMNPAVAAVVPARISVWVDHDTTYVGYFQPSTTMMEISPHLGKPGKMLDMKFHKIVEEATH